MITVGTVRLTRALYARFRLLAYELGKFGIVGAAAFAVTDAGTNLLHFRAGLGPLDLQRDRHGRGHGRLVRGQPLLDLPVPPAQRRAP